MLIRSPSVLSRTQVFERFDGNRDKKTLSTARIYSEIITLISCNSVNCLIESALFECIGRKSQDSFYSTVSKQEISARIFPKILIDDEELARKQIRCDFHNDIRCTFQYDPLNMCPSCQQLSLILLGDWILSLSSSGAKLLMPFS